MTKTAWLMLGLVSAAPLLLPACEGSGGGGGGGGTAGAPAAGGKRFFLPTGAEVRNTGNPSIETDAAGTLHMAYPAYAVGDAFYATCAAGCASDAEVKVVPFATQGTALNVMLALGPDQKPRVLISTANRVYYAACSGDCADAASWSLDVIVEHGGDREVSGEAFAIAPNGKPAFVMHSYRAFGGIGEPPPATWYAECDGASCGDPGAWKLSKIADQVWQESTLRFDSSGKPRLGTVATVVDAGGKQDVGAYVECTGDCSLEDGWQGASLALAYSNRWVEEIDPAISLALTKQGGARMLLLGKNQSGRRNLTYLSCDGSCTSDQSWSGGVLIESDLIGAGVDLVLDAADRPRFVYAPDWTVLLGSCDENCTAPDAPWKLATVELDSDIPTDQIFPYWNCHVAGWRLRHPSLALAPNGAPRVVYRAEDISAPGTPPPDPTKPTCHAGPDMTLTRFARLD